jgi:hypothetical protein
VTPESTALRESIRQGLIGAHIDRPEFEWAVARVYELEREKESFHIRSVAGGLVQAFHGDMPAGVPFFLPTMDPHK